VALFSSGLLIFSHVFLRPDVATHNDYFRAFMFVVIAFVAAELSRRIAKEQEALQAANQQFRANEQQLVSEVAERKKAEKALRESEGKLSAMLQSVADHMSMMDKDLNIIWANEKARNIFGDDIVGMKCYKAYHRRNKPCEPYPCLTLKAFQDGKVHKHDTQVVGKDGQIIYFHCTANVALRDANGKPTAVLEISSDITDRKKAEEALRDSEQRLKILFESAPDAIYLNDVKGNFVDGNKAAEEMTGYTREELIGKNLTESWLLSPEQVPKAVARLKKNAMGEPMGPDEFTLKRKDGSYVTVEIRTFPVRIGNKKLALGIARDISDRKKAEEAVRKERDKAQKYLDVAGVVLVVIDVEERVGLINKKGCEILEYEEEDVVGKNWFDNFLPERIRKEVKTVFKKLMAGKLKPVEYFENPILTKDGDERLIA